MARKKTKLPNGEPTKQRKPPEFQYPRYSKPRKGVGGRPSKYKADIYIPLVLEVMSEGGLKCHVIKRLYEDYGISMPTFYNWMENHKDFFNVIVLGEQLSEAWWVSKVKDNLILGRDEKFNSGPLIFVMKNAFNYSDKREVQQTETKEINIKIDLSSSSIEELKAVKEMTPEERRKKFKVA